MAGGTYGAADPPPRFLVAIAKPPEFEKRKRKRRKKKKMRKNKQIFEI